MIDDLGNRDLLRARDGLRDFVVVDQDEAGADGLEQVALGQDALERAVVVGDEQRVGGAGGKFLARVGEPGVGADGGELAVDDAIHRGRRADDPGGRGGVVGAADEADALGLGEFDDLGFDLEVAGDDEGADAEFDGALLNVAAVADDDERLIGGDFLALGNAPERTDVHRAEPDKQILDLALADEVERPGAEGAGDVGE